MVKYMQYVCIGFQVVRLGRFNQRVAGGAGMGTACGVGKKPGFPANSKGPDGIFG